MLWDAEKKKIAKTLLQSAMPYFQKQERKFTEDALNWSDWSGDVNKTEMCKKKFIKKILIKSKKKMKKSYCNGIPI